MLGLAIVLAGCGGAPPPLPTVGEPVFVVPSDGLPAEVVLQDANNNLGVVMHGGRRYLAWRTAPSHFASPDVVMWVVSSDDGVTWDLEARFALGTDLREMQFLSWDGELFLYFATLGTNPLDFEPGRMHASRMNGPGDWTEPVAVYEPGFIPWRTKVLQGRPSILGYTGGENVYDADGEPIRIQWLTTDDGLTFRPWQGDDPVVHEGGGSETDVAFLDDGGIVAVIRNEAGEDGVFGSFVCTAPPESVMDWTCASDPKKYDSPLLFRHDTDADRQDFWLIGRRNVTETGAYDLERDDLDAQDQYLTYQTTYWAEPKRCSVWKVDPDDRTVDFVVDLPSRGDTCFPDALDLGEGRFEVYNYTSPLDGLDVDWIEGQTGTTSIYRVDLSFP